MPRIKTEELLDRIEKNQFTTIRLSGFQDGKFCLILETEDGAFIHENKDGSTKHYPKVENVLIWLKRKTRLNKLEIDITLWRENGIHSHR
jgi:hypothetical protein